MNESRALIDAIEALAKSNLSFVDEMTQSRLVQQDMRATLVKIHEDNQQIIRRMDVMNERARDGEKRQGQSESRIRAAEQHIESLGNRIASVEAAVKIRIPGPAGASSANGAGR